MGNGHSRQQPRQSLSQSTQSPQYPAPTPQQQQQASQYHNQQQSGYSNGQYYGNFQQQQQQQPQYPAPQHYPPNLTHSAPPPPAPPRQAAASAQEYHTTATIRNQINLKKDSLAVAPLAGNPAMLSVSFTFDASESCRVTMFVCAHEDIKASCKLTPRAPPGPAVRYDKGFAHKFPLPGSDASAHTVNTAAFSVKDLTEAGADTFPLLIRLEALTDEGRAAKESLAELPLGGETPKWVQTQTTYARLVKEDDGTWGVRVLRQKIWVKGSGYELQEIYGMERNRTAVGTGVAAGLDDVEGNECVICMSAARDTTALPCRHMCMCHGCASALKTQTNKCPICRNEIESLLHIKINQAPAKPAAAPAPAAVAE